MLPELAPMLARALADARLVTIASRGERARSDNEQCCVLAAQLVSKSGILDNATNGASAAADVL